MKKFNQFISEKVQWYDIYEKLYILKSYINILNNTEDDYDIVKNYFIVLHNFLIIERMFFDDIVSHKKEINKYLKLEKLNTVTEVYDKFLELYDQWNIVRNNVETLENIDSVGKYLKENPKVYKKLL
jgi:hypothetical protein